MAARTESWVRSGIFLGGILVLLWPVMAPGPLLALDNVASPLGTVSLGWLSVPAPLFQRFLLFGGVGGTLAALWCITRTLSWHAYLVATMFVVGNPFLAERLGVGQWDLVFATGLSAWLLALPTFPRIWQRALVLLPTLALLAWRYPRSVSFVALLALAWLVAWVITSDPRARPWKGALALGAVVFGITLSRWGLPLVTDARLDLVDDQQFALFGVGEGGSALGAVGSLAYVGFWGARVGHLAFDMAKEPLAYLLLAALPLSVLGWAKLAKVQARFAWFIAVSYGLAWLVVLSGTGMLSPAAQAAFYEALGLVGLRETGKFMAIMLVAQAIGLAWATEGLRYRYRGSYRQVVVVLALSGYLGILLPLSVALSRPALHPVQLPTSLLALVADTNAEQQRAITVPWHRYQAYPFTQGRIVDQLGPTLFTNGQFNELLEYGPVHLTSADPWQQQMAQVTHVDPLPGEPLARLFAEHDLQLLVVFHTNDYQKYVDWSEASGYPRVAGDATFSAYRIDLR